MAGSRGLEPQHSQCSLLSSADQLRHSIPHSYPACTALSNDIQRSQNRRERGGGQAAVREEMQIQIALSANVSITLNTPFCEMQSSPFRLELY